MDAIWKREKLGIRVLTWASVHELTGAHRGGRRRGPTASTSSSTRPTASTRPEVEAARVRASAGARARGERGRDGKEREEGADGDGDGDGGELLDGGGFGGRRRFGAKSTRAGPTRKWNIAYPRQFSMNRRR